MININILPHTGVTFVDGDNNCLHTFTDFCLFWNIPSSGEELATSPEAKTHTIDSVPGINGIIDETEHFGEIRYKNRTLTLRFTDLHGNMQEWETNREKLFNKLHGKKFQIILDTDPDYYWEGRVSVTDAMDSATVSDVVITADVFPYKKSATTNALNVSLTAATETTVSMTNGSRMPVTLSVTTDKELTLTYDAEEYSFAIGTDESDFEIPEGTASIKLLASEAASVTFEWREGSL